MLKKVLSLFTSTNRIIILISTYICILILCFFSRSVKVQVNYEIINNAFPNGLTTLYFDNGDDFEEDDSVYEVIEQSTVQYSFRPITPVQRLCIMPTRIREQIVYLQSISFSIDGFVIDVMNGERLYDSIATELSSALVEYEDQYIKVQYAETADWAQVILNYDAAKLTNRISLGTLAKSLAYFLILLAPCIMVRIIPGHMKKRDLFLTIFICTWFFSRKIPSVMFLLIWLLPFIFVDRKAFLSCRKITVCNSIVALIFTQIVLIFSYPTITSIFQNTVLEYAIDYVCLMWIAWIGSLSLYFLLLHSSVPDCQSKRTGSYEEYVLAFATICVTLFLYECMKRYLSVPSFCSDLIPALVERMTSSVYIMNILWGVLFFLTLVGALGKGPALLIYGLLYIVLFVGNAIKISYHNTLLTPLDFLQIKEMLKISSTIMGWKIFLIIAFILLLLALIIYQRKIFLGLLKISPSLSCFFYAGIICFSFSKDVISSVYQDRNIFYKGYENEFVNEQDDGFMFYNLINLSKVSEVFMKKPENYTFENVQTTIKTFEEIEVPQSSVSLTPNVILIMAESLFDIENIDGLSFNQEILPTLKSISSNRLISPRYGGYTAAVEYEALTGLSLAFSPSALMPYTTYFNSKDKDIPSIVQEFHNNGYYTVAVHPNEKTFYNRDTAYQMLGFDTFLDKAAFEFTKDNVVAGAFLKDMPIAERLVELIEENEKPVFAFAVTIAGHYMSNDRYSNTAIQAYSDLLVPAELHEIEQAATAYNETDQMFHYLIDFIDRCEEPTLLYIFGDHLPPLPAFGKLDYTSVFQNKYSTLLAAYSNFKEIEMPELITPNQLAPQLLIDSGIAHSNYYNYIYSLRDTYPVIHQEFIDVNQTTDLDLYRMIIYDIMFGNQWFYTYSP